MPDEKIRVSARIPKELYDTCLQLHDNITNAINAGLELLCSQSEDKTQTHEDTRRQIEDNCQTSEDNNCKRDIQELKIRIEEKDKKIEEAQRQIKDLEENVRKAPDPMEFSRLQIRSEELEKYNQALKGELEKQLGEKEKELEFLKGQITIKDQQIDKQAFSLQSLIQENGRLNLKLLPEAQETKNTQENKISRWEHLKGLIFGSG